MAGEQRIANVRFTPESGYSDEALQCPLSANCRQCPTCRFKLRMGVGSQSEQCSARCFSSTLLTHKRRPLGVKCPVRNQKLHGDGIITRAEPHLVVALVSQFDLCHINFYTQAGLIRNADETFNNFERLFGQALALLPNPMSVNRGDLARRGGGNVGEHRQRNIEMVVRMGSPGEAPISAHLRDPHRALIVRDHSAIVKAIADGDPDRAQLELRDHLSQSLAFSNELRLRFPGYFKV
jgi:hypothetical protein